MKEEINQIIDKVLSKKGKEIGIDLVVDNNFYKDHGNYIVCAYNSKEYLSNGNISMALAGNHSLIIDKRDLNVYQLNSYVIGETSIEEQIEQNLIRKIIHDD